MKPTPRKCGSFYTVKPAPGKCEFELSILTLHLLEMIFNRVEWILLLPDCLAGVSLVLRSRSCRWSMGPRGDKAETLARFSRPWRNAKERFRLLVLPDR